MNYLLELIKRNEKILPSESQLMKKFNVSRETVRKAYNFLKEKKIVAAHQGRGYYVVSTKGNEPKTKEVIAVMLPFYNNYIFPEILQGIQDSLRDYSLMIKATYNSIEKETQILEEILTEEKVRGIIVEPTLDEYPRHKEQIKIWQEIIKKGISIVSIDGYYKFIDTSYVILDDYYGAKLGVEHLVKLGHQRIGGIFLKTRTPGRRRREGYVMYLKKYGIYEEKYDLVVEDMLSNEANESFLSTINGKANDIQSCFEFSVEQLKYELYKKWHIIKEVSAWICFNDLIALILVDVIKSKGLKIPEDVSIIGFDDSIFSNISDIKLTTIWHPKYYMGRKAAQIIKRSLSSEFRKQKEIIKPHLIIRESTGLSKMVGN